MDQQQAMLRAQVAADYFLIPSLWKLPLVDPFPQSVADWTQEHLAEPECLAALADALTLPSYVYHYWTLL